MESVKNSKEKLDNAVLLSRLWEAHDQMERDIIHLERKFTDEELDWLMGDDESAEVLYKHQQTLGSEEPEEWHE